jgi:glycosyltransferase involved in cell wall biosynthesis
VKVLIAAPYYYPRVGGLENYAAAIARGLHGRGWDVVVVCGDTSVREVRRETLDGYTVWRLPVWKVVFNTPVNPRWFRMLRQVIRAERPDIVNAHTPVPFMADVVMLAAGRVPVVITYHAATLVQPGGPARSLVTAAYRGIQFLTLARAAAIVAVSPYVKNTLSRHPSGKITVIPNAVWDVPPPNQRGGKGLVFVANLDATHAWKGLDAILAGLLIARTKYGISPPLVIVGDGGDRPRYERSVRELGLDGHVQFTGRLIGAERDATVRQAAAQVVYPTTANDGMPTVLLEGWAQGVPVIAAAIGSITALVTDHETGLVAAPNNPPALAAAIHELLDDPVEAAAMGEAGRQLVARAYTWPRQLDLTAGLLESLIGR